MQINIYSTSLFISLSLALGHIFLRISVLFLADLNLYRYHSLLANGQVLYFVYKIIPLHSVWDLLHTLLLFFTALRPNMSIAVDWDAKSLC